jgi:hypothetical protein
VSALFPTAVYLLCFLTSAFCAVLLARNYRRSGVRMLMWSGICFALLAAASLFVVIDLVVLPAFDFRLVRNLLSLSAVAVLLFGFIWDLER